MKNILDEAFEVTSGDRNLSYGHPLDNHTCTATLWMAYLKRKHGIDIPLSVRDVCWMNVLQKISRDANMEKRDNLIDACGWTRNVEMAEEEYIYRKDRPPDKYLCKDCMSIVETTEGVVNKRKICCECAGELATPAEAREITSCLWLKDKHE